MKKQDKNSKIKVSKDKRIEIRVTEDFFQEFDQTVKATGLKRPDFFEQIFYQGKVVLVKKDYNNLATQVRKCGVNLNEIAFVLNIANQKNALNNNDYQALLIELKLIQMQLNRIGV
jgi:hypothetical protein